MADEIENSERDPELEPQRPRTMLKITEWGLLTIASLLSSFAFPPYFMAVMTLAFLNAGGLLWVTHLSEKGRQRVRDFEAEFRVGHEHEEAGRPIEAVGIYLSLKPRFHDIPQLETLCDKQIANVKRSYPAVFREAEKAAKAAKAARKRKSKADGAS